MTLKDALARLHALAMQEEADYEAYLRVAQALVDLETRLDRSPQRLIEKMDAQYAELLTLVPLFDLRPYARHLDGCPQAPCTCGLAAVLGPPAA